MSILAELKQAFEKMPKYNEGSQSKPADKYPMWFLETAYVLLCSQMDLKGLELSINAKTNLLYFHQTTADFAQRLTSLMSSPAMCCSTTELKQAELLLKNNAKLMELWTEIMGDLECSDESLKTFEKRLSILYLESLNVLSVDCASMDNYYKS